MRARTILFPTDFSHTCDAALDMATSLARESGAKLLIVHVEEPPPAYVGGEHYYGIHGTLNERLEETLAAVTPTDPSVEFEHRLITGTPPNAILRLAKDEDVFLIVMGTHGRRRLSRALIGSVAETVVRRAKCPVMTLKQPVKTIETV